MKKFILVALLLAATTTLFAQRIADLPTRFDERDVNSTAAVSPAAPLPGPVTIQNPNGVLPELFLQTTDPDSNNLGLRLLNYQGRFQLGLGYYYGSGTTSFAGFSSDANIQVFPRPGYNVNVLLSDGGSMVLAPFVSTAPPTSHVPNALEIQGNRYVQIDVSDTTPPAADCVREGMIKPGHGTMYFCGIDPTSPATGLQWGQIPVVFPTSPRVKPPPRY